MDFGWSELELHVLAQLCNTAELPSSVYGVEYLRDATAPVGSASERNLAADIAVQCKGAVTRRQ
jgi:hypothetical protein